MGSEHWAIRNEIAEWIGTILSDEIVCNCELIKHLVESVQEQDEYYDPDEDDVFCHGCQDRHVFTDTLYSYYLDELKRDAVVDVLKTYNIENLKIVELVDIVREMKQNSP